MGSFLQDAQEQPLELGSVGQRDRANSGAAGVASGAAISAGLSTARRVLVSQEDVSVFAAPWGGGEPRRQG